MKRELNRKLVYKCRCDERLKAKVEGSTQLTYNNNTHKEVCLLLINKTRDKEKNDILVSVRWKFFFFKTKNEESTRLSDTGLVVELEHLKTKTRSKDEKFASVKGECET
jgi:hypothetical protein